MITHRVFTDFYVFPLNTAFFSRKASRKSYDPLGALGAKFTKNSRITHCCSLVTRCTTAKTAKPRSVFTVQIIHFFEFSHFFENFSLNTLPECTTVLPCAIVPNNRQLECSGVLRIVFLLLLLLITSRVKSNVSHVYEGCVWRRFVSVLNTKKNQMQISRKKLRSKRLLVGSFGSSEVHAQKTLLAPEHLQKLGPNRQIWKV